jgi:ABC-type Fe3+/spermidine/putrescine transport system ATPase subunit
MSLLTVAHIAKKHGDDFLLKDISFIQAKGWKIAIAGETGSGKTTLMRIIAGLGQADSGEVWFEQTRVKGVDEKLMPGHKGIAYLSQHFELHNNYRVSEALNYAGKLNDNELATLCRVCRIDHLLHRWTQSLSGGEKQRVALARLLTFAPRLLLLDEPFSNMDLIHKQVLKSVVSDVGDRLGVTCMLISHDPEDMLPWADEIFIMKQGNILQRGDPRHIYKHPETDYAAGLFGKYNIITPDLAKVLPGYTKDHGAIVRPDDLGITGVGSGITGTVTDVAFLGSHYELTITVAGHSLLLATTQEDINAGAKVNIDMKSIYK